MDLGLGCPPNKLKPEDLAGWVAKGLPASCGARRTGALEPEEVDEGEEPKEADEAGED